MFDANLSQSNTHNYTCLTVRVKASVQSLLSIIILHILLIKPKINLPNRESKIHFPRL